MSDIRFTVEDTETKGRILAHIPGHSETPEITFSKSSATMVIVDHTGVPDSLTGQGIGTKLGQRMVELARQRGYKTVLLCPFYKAAIDRHPEWADVLA